LLSGVVLGLLLREALQSRRPRPVAAPSGSTGTFIYVLRSDGNVRGCKVGITGNPTARLRQLRSTSPCRLGFAFLATVEDSAGARRRVRALGLLARHRTEGEWCGCSSELAVAAINWTAARQDLRLGAIADPAIADQILAAASPRSRERPF
jgi:hypothetical protein